MLDIMTQFVFTIGKRDGNNIQMLGTGFLISNGQYVVAPRHVVGDSDDGLVIILPSISSFDEYQDTDDVSVGDEVYILGFPHCVEGRRVLTMQTALIGAKILLNCSGVKAKHCVINTQTRPGQSGSMIFSKKLNKIIGILIGAFSASNGISLGGINPRELHQTTQCLSGEYISKMIGD